MFPVNQQNNACASYISKLIIYQNSFSFDGSHNTKHAGVTTPILKWIQRQQFNIKSLSCVLISALWQLTLTYKLKGSILNFHSNIHIRVDFNLQICRMQYLPLCPEYLKMTEPGLCTLSLSGDANHCSFVRRDAMLSLTLEVLLNFAGFRRPFWMTSSSQ